MAWLIIGFILLAIAVVIAVIRDIKLKIEQDVAWHITVFCVTFLGMIGIINYISNSLEFNTTCFTLDTEIRQEIVNNQVTKSDTIYIIKKK